MTKTTKLHICDKDVHDVAILRSAEAQVFYEERSNGWWMEMGFGSCAINYCPFCGLELKVGPDMEDVNDKDE